MYTLTNILASGCTIGNHLVQWLEAKNGKNVTTAEFFLNDNYQLSVNLF